jgi:hypothetical protein
MIATLSSDIVLLSVFEWPVTGYGAVFRVLLMLFSLRGRGKWPYQHAVKSTTLELLDVRNKEHLQWRISQFMVSAASAVLH